MVYNSRRKSMYGYYIPFIVTMSRTRTQTSFIHFYSANVVRFFHSAKVVHTSFDMFSAFQPNDRSSTPNSGAFYNPFVSVSDTRTAVK
jgi:hypothetical protein